MPVLERRPHGRRIACPGGYRAYVPAPLPPLLAWDERLIAALSAADRAIGALAGEGRRLPNPRMLVRPFVHKEAVLSSRIEGTRTTLGELLADEAGAAVDQSPDDLREVANYVSALDYGLGRLDTLPLSLRLVRELHDRLMRGVRDDIAAPGEFRRSQNWIGRPGCTLNDATYVPPPPAELLPCLDAWEHSLHDDALPPLVQAALVHVQFEAIHPFLDGNGRVGRLLITLLLAERDVLPAPLLYLSAYFEATRPEYYARLLGVTERGEWEEWLVYFLRGRRAAVAGRAGPHPPHRRPALGVEARAGPRPLPRPPPRPRTSSPRTPSGPWPAWPEDSASPFTTAQRAIDCLEAAGVVARVGEARRNRLSTAPSRSSARWRSRSSGEPTPKRAALDGRALAMVREGGGTGRRPAAAGPRGGGRGDGTARSRLRWPSWEAKRHPPARGPLAPTPQVQSDITCHARRGRRGDHLAGRAVGAAEPSVQGQQWAVERLGQRHVPGVVDRQGATQGPYPLGVGGERKQRQRQLHQLALRARGLAGRDLPGQLHAAQGVGRLGQRQLRARDPVHGDPGFRPSTIAPGIDQGGDQQRRVGHYSHMRSASIARRITDAGTSLGAAALRARTASSHSSMDGWLAARSNRSRWYTCIDRRCSAARSASLSLTSSGTPRVVICSAMHAESQQ